MDFDFPSGTILDVAIFDNGVIAGPYQFLGTHAILMPVGTTAERPSLIGGQAGIRYNTTLGRLEYFDSNTTTWSSAASESFLSAGYQPLDADLTAIAALATTGVIVRTGAGTVATRTITGTAGNISIADGDGVAGNPTVDLINAGTPISDSFVRITTDAKGRVTASTAVGSSDITTALGYTPVNRAGDTMTGFLTLNADPTAALHAATKQYVDSIAAGFDPKASCRVATTAAIDLAAPGATIDGVTMASGDRVLVKNGSTTNPGTTSVDNGIWVWNGAASAMTRATDFDGSPSGEVTAGAFSFVSEGTTYADTGWFIVTNDPITVGTTALTWSQFSGVGTYVGANGIQVSGTTIQTDPASLLRSLHNLATTGILVQTVAGTANARTLQQPAAGITITNPAGIAGDPTFALANDLAAVEGLAGTGLAVRTAADTWTTRTITGTAARIDVTNGDGVSGAPTIDISATYVGQASITTLGTITTGVWNGTTIAIANGGTGATTATAAFDNLAPTTTQGDIIYYNGTDNVRFGIGTANQVLGVNAGATAPEYKTITAGTNITVVHGVGTITINATSGSSLQLYAENPSAPTTPTASGTNAVAIGNANTASGQESITLGGNDNLASATYSAARGNRAVASLYGQFAFASDAFSADGDGQASHLTLYANTNGAVTEEMFLDGPGGTQRMVLPNNTAWTFRILVVAKETGTAAAAGYQFLGVIRRAGTAASTTIVASSQTTIAEDDTAWDVDVSADTTNGALIVTVDGAAADDINWVASVELAQVTY